MRITCPHCGERGNEEFSYLGDADAVRPATANAVSAGDATTGDVEAGNAGFDAWMDYVYIRRNPAGPHRELWQHVHGCRAWLVVTRDVRTHTIAAVEAALDVARARTEAGKASATGPQS